MKSKHLAILLGLVVVLAGVAWFLNREPKDTGSGEATAGARVLELPDINATAQVSIQAPGGTIHLVRKTVNNQEIWTVQERADFPANFEQISGMLRKLWELKTVQGIKVGPSQFARLELAEPGQPGAGTRVEFKDKDGKALGTLMVGKKFVKNADSAFGEFGMMPAGRYVMPGGANAKVSLVSEPLEELEPKPEHWLKHDFIKVENPTSIALAGTTDAMKWKLTRENGNAPDWKLEGAKENEKPDAAKTGPLSGALANASFTDVLTPDAKPADTGLDKPAVLAIETQDHFTYVLKVGKATGDNYPVTIEVSAQLAKERTPGKDEKPEDKEKLDTQFKETQKRLEEKLAAEKKFEGRPFLISKFTMDQFLKDRSALLPEKPAEPPPGAPPGVNPGAAFPPGLQPPNPGAFRPGTPPASPGRAPVEAVTPAVSVDGVQVKPPPTPTAPGNLPKETPKPTLPPPAANPKPGATNPAPANPAKPANPAPVTTPAAPPAKPAPGAKPTPPTPADAAKPPPPPATPVAKPSPAPTPPK
jgi:hypothetical protein